MVGTTLSDPPGTAPLVDLDFVAPEVDVERRDDGTIILSSPRELLDYDRHVGEMLRRAASQSTSLSYPLHLVSEAAMTAD